MLKAQLETKGSNVGFPKLGTRMRRSGLQEDYEGPRQGIFKDHYQQRNSQTMSTMIAFAYWLTLRILWRIYLGGCQNYGPLLDHHYNAAPNI